MSAEEGDSGCTKPHVGVGIIIRHDERILLGRRVKPPMTGSWQLPGGWMHLGESPEQAVTRLLAAFTGGVFTSYQFINWSNNVFDKNTHTLTLYFMTKCINGDLLELTGNTQCSDWHWADWLNLPQPLFLPLKKLQQTGFIP